MRENPFQTGGPLPPDSPVYVERKADKDILFHARKMDYVKITEPRQQGKTSLLYRLRYKLSETNQKVIFVDLEDLNNTSEAAWYKDLADRLKIELTSINKDFSSKYPVDSQSWRKYLTGLVTPKSQSYPDSLDIDLIIAFDEVGSVPSGWAEAFFRVLRGIYNSREVEEHFKHLSFLLAGAFDSRNLISDPSISPFNIAHQINLLDFNVDQVKNLLTSSALPQEYIDFVVGKIMYWTNGQPYLSQKLCSLLAMEEDEEISITTVDKTVNLLFQNDTQHLPRIAQDINRNINLQGVLHKILSEPTIYMPAVNEDHFNLGHVIGIIKPDEQGYCKIRNKIYERAFPQILPYSVSPKEEPISFAIQDLEEIPLNERISIPFRLKIDLLDETRIEVSAIETPLGEPNAEGRIAYTDIQLTAILKALRCYSLVYPSEFNEEEQKILDSLKFIRSSQLVPDLLQRVGEDLYNMLMVGDIHTAFTAALNQARQTSSTVALQLRFSENAVSLARYPWELLYNRRHLLPSGAVEMTRYISYGEAPTALSVKPPLKLLYIESRPKNLSQLPSGVEQTSVREAISQVGDEVLKVYVPCLPTYIEMIKFIDRNKVNIIHFDGHGIFARKCSKCASMNYAHKIYCEKCKQKIDDIDPMGYLAFETDHQDLEWIDSQTLGTALSYSGPRLVVLSACWSSYISGTTMFTGTAPALIEAGVPSVVSAQLPISVNSANMYMQGFYDSLGRFETLPRAVNRGRVRILNTREWFIPTLHLRSKDDKGELFLRK